MGNEESRIYSIKSETRDNKYPACFTMLSSVKKSMIGACGGLSDAIDEDSSDSYENSNREESMRRKTGNDFADPADDESLQTNPMSALFARALISEVTDNPRTMNPTAMAEREKRLLKAQERAKSATKDGTRVVGTPGGIVGSGSILGAMSNFAIKNGNDGFKTDSDANGSERNNNSRILPPNALSENRAQFRTDIDKEPPGKHRITIGLSLSRRHSTLGHPDTVTRQTAFDFNELQDRKYKYVSSTDSSGWRAGGGEKGGGGNGSVVGGNQQLSLSNTSITYSHSEDGENSFINEESSRGGQPLASPASQPHKVAAPDTVHIPIIHIDCDSPAAVDSVIAALARGEIFIPHMSVLPEALGVNGVSPPDLVVRFGCERNEDIPPEEWHNWCLEFMHNQLYEYFPSMAQWMQRPFQIPLAKKVRWKTVKHMNKFFAHSEHVINGWRERGPQSLDPQLSYIDGGATPDEVARPHGIYLLRNGRPTNYFPPNFDPPYTTKMTRSLLLNVISKSWDKKRRDWTSEPVQKVVTPGMLFSTILGCSDSNSGGFIASEATNNSSHTHPNANQLGGNNNPQKGNSSQNLKHQSKYTNNISDDEQSGRTPTYDQESSNSYAGTTSKTGSTLLTPTSQSKHGQRNRSPGPIHLDKDVVTPEISQSVQTSKRASDDNESSQVENTSDNFFNSDEFHTLGTTEFNEQLTNSESNSVDFFDSLDSNDFSSQIHSNPKGKYKKKENSNVSRNNYKKSNGLKVLDEEAVCVPKIDEKTAHGDKSGKEESGHNMDFMSIGESQTTIPIMNGSQKFIEDVRQRRKQHELERAKEREKMDELELAIQEKRMGNKEKESKKKGKKDKKKDKKKKKDKHKDKKKEISLIETDISAKEEGKASSERKQQQNLSLSPSPTRQVKSADKRTLASQDNSFLPRINNDPVGKRTSRNSHPSLEIRPNASMDYSVDTASLLGDGSLIGGQFAGDGSVITMNTSASENRSLLSNVTRSTVHDATDSKKKVGKEMDDDDISLSILESCSTEQIPSDEDLFAIGWAKAVDPNSGTYYYFSLDRSKIVWDNPLLTQLEA